MKLNRILFVIVAGALISGAEGFSFEVRLSDNSVIAHSISLESARQFALNNPFGDIEIVEGEAREARLLFSRGTGGRTQEGSGTESDPLIRILDDGIRVETLVTYPSRDQAGPGGGVTISRRGGQTTVSVTGRPGASITGLRISRSGDVSTIVNGQTVIINGQIVGDNTSNAVTARLQIHGSLLADLVAQSSTGRIGVRGAFSAPHHRRVTLENSSGNIFVSGVRAGHGLLARSSSGDIKLVQVWGDVFAQSVSGDLAVVETQSNQIFLRSSNGEIETSDSQGALLAETISGDVSVRTHQGTAFVKAMSGSLLVKNLTQGFVVGETLSGDIKFANPDARSEYAKSLSGSVRTTRGVPICEASMVRWPTFPSF